MKRFFSIVIALTFACIAALAQGSVRVQAPGLVGVGEQFNVTVTAEGSEAPEKPEWNPGSDFQLVWGPQKVGSGSSINIVNGKKTSRSQVTYIFILQARNKGTFTLPSVTARIDGEKVSSNQITIEVADAAGRNDGSSQLQQQEERPVKKGNTEAFLRFSINKNKVVVGEPVKATLKLFTTADIAGFEDAKLPTFNGFWSQETYSPQNIEFSREKVGDAIYLSAVLREYTLIPQQTGSIEIEPAEIVCVLNVRYNSSTGSIFDSFFEEYQTVRRKATSVGYTVKVSPLPAGAPVSFGGGVGEFSISSSLSVDSLKTHEAASLVIKVTGNGNIALLEAPKVDFPSDFDVYDVKTVENIDNGKLSGSKTFEYPFIPRSHGEFSIPAVEYSYYDYKKGKYVTVKTAEQKISVKKGKENSGSSSPVLQNMSKKNVKDLGNDIRYVCVRKPEFARKDRLFAASTAYFVIFALIVLLGAVACLALRKVFSMKEDVVMVKNKAAVKMARRRLAAAGTFLDKNLYTAFYEELHSALLGYVSDKLNMDVTELSKDNICSELEKNGVTGQIATDFTGLIDACEYARYSPDRSHEAMDQHYSKAVDTITSIDSCMKGKRKAGAAAASVVVALFFGTLAMNAAAPSDSLWQNGLDAYDRGDFAAAVSSWEAISDSGEESAELYFNLGNAYYKDARLGKATVNYMRALRLNPSYSDARFNLEFVQAQTMDQIDGIPDFFLKSWAKAAASTMPADTWAVLSLIFLLGLCVCICLYVLGRSRSLRKGGFIAGAVCLAMLVCAFSFMLYQRSEYRNETKSVVIQAVCPAKSSPNGGNASNLFVIHEGTIVTVIDEVGEWKSIELSDGRKGWVESSNIEII